MGQRLRGTYVRSIALAGFTKLVEQRGGNSAEILTRAGVDPVAAADINGLIGWPPFCAALEVAAEQLNEPDFGFDLAMSVPDVFPNAVAPVLMAHQHQSLLEWVSATATHWRFSTNGYTVEVRPTADGGCCLRLVFPQHSFTQRQAIELTFATFCRLWRSLGGHNDNPKWVHFRHQAPAGSERLVAFFGPGIAFGQSHFELGLSPEQMQAPMAPTEERKRALVDFLVRSRIETEAGYDQSMTQTVELVISSILGAGLSNMAFVASSLSLNPKKLQRLLASENTTFSAVLDGVRARLALHLLTTTDVGIAQIAGLLDYAATAPFSLAVRRWYAMSPVALRHRIAQDDLEGRPRAVVGPAPTAG